MSLPSYQRVAVITGLARSGTSWIGQIFESCPDVCYRMSPLFSYEFKNHVQNGASREAWEHVLQGAYNSSNDFMRQTVRREAGEYPTFSARDKQPPVLVIKYNRFQNLIEEMLELFPELKMVAVIRNPCGAIHSWLTAPKEFPPDADVMQHWRSGAIKKTGYGDYFGFDDWKWATQLHLRLARERPDQFRWVCYEDYVVDAAAMTNELFQWMDLRFSQQTINFLAESQRDFVAGDYSVFKHPSVKDRWRTELQSEIRDAIYQDLAGTELEVFLK